MPDTIETSSQPVTPEAPANPAPLQAASPAELQPERLRPAAYKAAELDGGIEAFRKYYEERGGTYFKAYEDRLTKQEQSLSQLQCDYATERAINMYGLKPEDAALIRGATPEEINERASALAARLKAEQTTTPPQRSAEPKPTLPAYAAAPMDEKQKLLHEVYSGLKRS